MIPLKAMNSLQCYNRYYGSTFLHHPYPLMENQRASASEDTVKNHLTEKMKETIRKQQNSPSIREAIKHSPPPPSSMSTSPKPLEKQILNYPQMHHQRTQELYNNLQKIQELQTIHQKTQEMYKDLQTPPPEKTPQIPNHPSHFQTIHQKTQEMYKNLQTPPPEKTQTSNNPLYPSPPNHIQLIHQKQTQEMYNSLQTPPPQENKRPNYSQTIMHQKTQLMHQKTQELYKNLQTPPPHEMKTRNPPPPPQTQTIYENEKEQFVQTILENQIQNRLANQQKDNFVNKQQTGKIRINNLIKPRLDYLFIITESKLPKFEFWRTFSLVSEVSFVY